MRPPRQFEDTVGWLREALPLLPDDYGQLPSERTLAERRKISVPTLRKALSVLAKEGLVTRRHGKGTFIREPRLKVVRSAASKSKKGAGRPRTLTVGVIGQEASASPGTSSGMYSDIYRGLLDEASRQDLGLSFSVYGADEATLTRFTQLIEAGRVQACILMAITDPAVQRRIANLGCPCVLVDHWPEKGLAMDSVNVDSEADTREAVRILSHLQHRTIVFMDRKNPKLNPERRKGFEIGLRDAGLKLDSKLVVNVSSKAAEIERTFCRLMARKPQPTAIMVHDVGIALAIMRAAEARGIRVPDDLSVVGFGGVQQANAGRPAVARIATDFEEMGRQAIRRLGARMKNDESSNQDFRVPGQFLAGQTVAPAGALQLKGE